MGEVGTLCSVWQDKGQWNTLISPENTKTNDFNPQRTLSGSFFVIFECLGSIHAIVLAFTANKETLSNIYIDSLYLSRGHCQTPQFDVPFPSNKTPSKFVGQLNEAKGGP